MAPEAQLVDTDAGLAPGGTGWFVVNARDARWRERPGRGFSLALTGSTDYEAETFFTQLGVNIAVLGPGEPIAMYHWENDQEGLLILYGEALLLVEGEERTLKQWDYFHSPPGAKHTIIGAGNGPCAVLAVGSRQFMATDDWGAYSADEIAQRHGVSPKQDTSESGGDDTRYGETTFTRYREGWLPEE